MTDELDLIKEVASRLENAGIKYMMTGSMAMAIYSTPRMTRDIDMVIQVSPDDTGKIFNLFQGDFYIDESAVREAIQHHGMFNMIHNDSIIKFDFIVRKNEEYRVLEFSRRQQIDIGGRPVSVVAPEDLILSKLVFERMNDTTPDMQKRMAVMIAELSPAERLRMASSMFDTGRTLVRIGLLKQKESLNEGQIRAQVFLRFYADDFTAAEIKEIASHIPNMILDDENQAA